MISPAILFALASVDYAVLAVYFASVLAVGLFFYFGDGSGSNVEYFLGGRRFSAWPLGLSLAATTLTAQMWIGIPGNAYYSGIAYLALPLAVWLVLPLASRFFVPLFRGLSLESIYAYLELRFDPSTRRMAGICFLLWRVLWLGVLVSVPCHLLAAVGVMDMPAWLLIVVVGLVSTASAALGGIKAVVWTDVLQAAVMLVAFVCLLVAICLCLDGGAGRAWEVAGQLGRRRDLGPVFSQDSDWTFWGSLPYFAFAMLSLFVADQITAQRFLASSNTGVARQALLVQGVAFSVVIPVLTFTGMGVLAFYHDNPAAMRPRWVANIDAVTRESVLDSETGKPLLDWDEPGDRITASNVDKLIAEDRLIRPNSREPFETGSDVVDASGEPDVNRLAMRRPPARPGVQGEVILHRRAPEELLAWFIRSRLPWGVLGLVLAGLFAAAMSSLDSGLNSVSSFLLSDFHDRPGGVGRAAGGAQRAAAEEVRLARAVTVFVGLATTTSALLFAWTGPLSLRLVAAASLLGGPLLAVFLLGVFTRRCNAFGARAALGFGVLTTPIVSVFAGVGGESAGWIGAEHVGVVWPSVVGGPGAAAVGYLASLVGGTRPEKSDLRGLVLGVGTLGDRTEEASVAIEIPGAKTGD